MNTDLERFRDHAAAMARPGAHVDDCHAVLEDRWGANRVHPDPDCDGCVTPADRALWARLAAEVDTYLAGDTCPDCGQQPGPAPEDGLFHAVTVTCTTCTPATGGATA